LYIDNILARVELQIEAYRKETGIPAKLFQVLETQREGLTTLKKQYGPIATPAQLLADTASQ
jgi:phosphoenolpyruvate carboxykinase (GTP)